MYGIEAINAANGWNLSALGILVVFSSLIILSVIISQLHRILAVWDKKEDLLPGAMTLDGSQIKENEKAPSSGREKTIPHPHVCPGDINEIAAIWAPLVEQLDDPFLLADLYKLAVKNGFPHPHMTIQRLRQENILVPAGNRMFRFQYERKYA